MKILTTKQFFSPRAALTSLAIFAAGILAMQADDYYAGRRDAWLSKAEHCKPILHASVISPKAVVTPVKDERSFQNWRYDSIGTPSDLIFSKSLKEVRTATVDFGRHMTGYFTFHTKTLFRCQDAPVRIKFSFAELPAELNTPVDPWVGTLSRAWIQEEVINVRNMDTDITIPCRLACRYVKIELLGASPDFDFSLDNMHFTAYSSASGDIAMPSGNTCDEVRKIHDVSVETLRECMQTVYEDGPKRDQRLWSGDLYLQSLANRYTFRNFDLTKRCLYLFAALADEDGEIIANLFENPTPHPQLGSFCLSYSLLYNSTLLEYLKDTNDYDTARDLWPVANRQIEKALEWVDANNMFNPDSKPGGWFFFDWRNGFDPTTPMHAAIIFALQQTAELASLLGENDNVKGWLKIADNMKNSARKNLFDKKQGVFLSGNDRQISVLSQTWMIKAGVLNKKEARIAISNALANPLTVMPGTPYAMHYLVEAMITAGMHNEARAKLIDYWGGMVKKGADTFWESYDPDDDFISAYNCSPLNSACHAWSCTPVYFIHKYPEVFL